MDKYVKVSDLKEHAQKYLNAHEHYTPGQFIEFVVDEMPGVYVVNGEELENDEDLVNLINDLEGEGFEI